jgi:hypothetical protein
MNIIDCIYNLVEKPITNLTETYKNRNRANNAGDALEEYIKDLFCNSFDCEEHDRLEKISKVFSYSGNNSNPPDMMLKNGDAIEVKKIENDDSALALNSSYPKQKLFSSSNMISNSCRNCEYWDKKDMIYAVGVVDKKNDKLKHLCMVYGLDYCANDECYSRIKSKIKTGVESIMNIEFQETNELGKIKKIDPLGITYLRIRGMWGIKNPWTVFDYVYKRDFEKEFNFMCIINNAKWNTFTNTGLISNIEKAGFEIKDVRIKDPDNPSQLRNAKLITYSE